MPPRIPISLCSRPLGGLHVSFANLALKPVTQSTRTFKTKKRGSRKKKDNRHPYILAQVRQRKTANVARRRTLEEARQAAVGEPVLGNPTPFTESLQKAHQLGATYYMKDNVTAAEDDAAESASSDTRLNYFMTTSELKEALEYSKSLTRPAEQPDDAMYDPESATAAERQHEEESQNAEEAIKRIAKLGNASGDARARVNIQRCIEEFGRHHTDQVLDPKPAAFPLPSQPQPSKEAKRAGPDTGSSEVQIAILTSKILVLSKQLEKTGHKDKQNTRNLKLLVHRRQKLLKYLRRKERGGPRWQNLMEKLGLSDASWKGEITM